MPVFLMGKARISFWRYEPLTRGELAVWIAKAFDLKGSTVTNFTDVPAKHAERIGSIILYDIAEGISDTEFGYNQKAKLIRLISMLQLALKAPRLSVACSSCERLHMLILKIHQDK